MRWFGAKKAVAIAILALVSGLLVCGPTIWKTLAAIGPAKAADAYIRALAAGDRKTALACSSGSAAWVAGTSVNTAKAEVKRIRVSVPEIGRNYAEVLAYIELALSDGSRDAGWYRLILAREDEWKVVSVTDHPWAPGFLWFAPRQDTVAAEEVFNSYLRLLAENRYGEAARYLCGPARRAHEKGAAALGRAALFKETSDVTLVPVWKRGNQMVCRARYRVDGRLVEALVRFARLGDGWHISGIEQT